MKKFTDYSSSEKLAHLEYYFNIYRTFHRSEEFIALTIRKDILAEICKSKKKIIR